MEKELNKILDVITSYLVRNYHVSRTSMIIKQFSQQMAVCLFQRYMTPISYLSVIRARKEFQMMRSIQERLQRGKYILRVTDKSGVFHIGHAKDYEQKAEAYRQKTHAYIELDHNPLWEIFDKVVQLLNNLRSKKQIRAWQLHQMMPKKDKVKLAYLYTSQMNVS